MRGIVIAACIALLLMPVAGTAVAASRPAQVSLSAGQFDQDWIDPGVGFLDLSETGKARQALDLRVEYRFGTSLFPAIENIAVVRPFVGIEVTADTAFYGLGGLAADIGLGPFVLTPSFGVGFYRNGDGKDLGSSIQFRSQIELGYEFESHARIGVAYSHISNAGLSKQNPGANLINLYLHIPANAFFGN